MMISLFPYMALAEDTASATEGSTTDEMTNEKLKAYIDENIAEASVKLPAEPNLSKVPTEFHKGIVKHKSWIYPNTDSSKEDNYYIYSEYNSNNYIKFSLIGLKEAVAVYTGENNDIRFPITANLYSNKNDNGPRFNLYIKNISLPEAQSNFQFGNEYWDRCIGENNLNYYNDAQEFSSKSDGNRKNPKASFNSQEKKSWRNYIKYTGDGNTDSYYEKLPKKFQFVLQYESNKNTNTPETKELPLSANMYVLNMKPYKDILGSLEKDYNAVKSNESNYTQKALNNYYKAVCDIINFDITPYLTKVTTENDVVTAASAVKTVVENYNLAKKINLDSTAYIAQKEQCDIIIKNQTANNEYDINSYTEFKKIYDDVIEKAKTVEDQKALDDLTAQLITAQSMLRKKSITITYRVFKNDKEETESEKQQSYTYGDTVNYDYTLLDGESIKAWTVKDEINHAYTRVGTNEKNFSLVATRDLYVDVYVTTKQVSTAEYSKVTFIGPGGNIIDIKYVEKDKTLAKSEFPKAPKIPFYTFNNSWSTENVIGTGKDIEVRAIYIVGTQNCRVHFNNNELSYYYDELVKLDGYDSTKKYALAKDADGKNIITYLDRDSFHAPRTDDIYVVEVSETEAKAKIGITGNFGDTDGEGRKLAAYNCKFYLPAGCTAVEWGLEINNGKTIKQVQSNVQNDYNEYSVTVRYKKDTKVEKIICRAYLTYKTSDQYVTIYSDHVEQAISTL
ncbi:hypothetical protein [uncultured Eubacterium sp.]|uniref:hypothetical protein n=1 Tax=uncultured Eubacterium sp. TaxID=165185 RepID=UPI002626D674|nr:hypothetical protein [uncultured Eubacterium sp.]